MDRVLCNQCSQQVKFHTLLSLQDHVLGEMTG